MKETSLFNFDELLKQLSKAHLTELDSIKKKCESEVNVHKNEADKLRAENARLQKQAAGLAKIVRSKSQESALDECQEDEVQDEHTKAILDDLEGIDLMEEDESGNFNLLSGWKQSLAADAGYSFEKTMQLYSATPPSQRPPRVDGSGSRVAQNRFVIFPSCTFRLAWDVCGLVLISYDLMTIPFNQAFQPAETLFSKTTDWVTLVFWTGDMFQGFFLGYYQKGEVITDNYKIIKNYIKTWLIVDSIVVVPEWTVKFLPSPGEGGQVGDLGKIAKFARVARVLRLLRLLKMKKLLETLVDRIESEYSFILFNLVHLLCFVMVLNHVIACLWYLIGRLSMSEGLTNWVDVGNVKGSKISYLYATSLHWSLTQFTPASMDISARNLWERLFSVVVLLFAMLVFSSIVASITAAMTALRNLQGNEMRQFWLLRRYLRQRKVRPNLSSRIIKFLEHRSAVQGTLVQRDRVPILAHISEALQDELMYEMHSPELLAHPFFQALGNKMPAVMHRLCRIAIMPQNFAVQDMVFSAGDESKKTFFVKSGELDYTVLTSGICEALDHKDWISEPTLFTTWRHRGTLQAMTGAELIAVDPKQFMTVMSVHPKPWHYAVRYAKAFLKYLNGHMGDDELTDLLQEPGMYDEIMGKATESDGDSSVPLSGSDIEKTVDTSPSSVHPTTTRVCETASPTMKDQRFKSESGSEDDRQEYQTYKNTWWTPICRLWLPCQEVLLSRFRG